MPRKQDYVLERLKLCGSSACLLLFLFFVGLTAFLGRFNDRVLKSKNPFHSISIPIVENFLEWTICQKLGKNGRLKRGTKTSGSLQTRWKLLSIVYKVATGKNFKPCIYEGISEVCHPRNRAYIRALNLRRFCNDLRRNTICEPRGEGTGL